MDLGRPLLESAPNSTQPRQIMTSKTDEPQGDRENLEVHPPAHADGNQKISSLLADVSSQRPSVEHPREPKSRNHHLVQAPLPHQQPPVTRSDLLSPPTAPSPRSDSGRSYMSFTSISSVHDCGVESRAAWVSSHPRGPFRRPNSLEETPITLKSLSHAIWGSFERSQANAGQKFLPLDALDALINPTTIRGLLESEKLFPGGVSETLQGIFGGQACSESQNPQQKPNLQRILAILILMKKVQAIRKFISNGIDDSILPLSSQSGNNSSPAPNAVLCNRDTADIDDAKLQDCFTEFDYNDWTLFLTYQKSIHVPFFQFPRKQHKISFYDLEGDCILPFTEVGELKGGGFGSVRQIRIHPAHHNIEEADISFAVKTLHQEGDDGMFRNEVEAFAKLPHMSQPCSPDHLMHLELVYRHGEKCCLIFPWANGNLGEYWRLHERSPDNWDDVVWFFEQCLGIAKGLSRLHNPTSYEIANTPKDGQFDTEEMVEAKFRQAKYGRHGDIKPENILWFASFEGNSDHLVISDFGLTKFNSFWSKSHAISRDIPGYSGTYKSPELGTNVKITQKYDIWSLGCVFLELASWLLLGSDAPAAFSDERLRSDCGSQSSLKEDKFFCLNSDGGSFHKVKPCVIEWIQSLHALDTCPNSVHDFLDIIEMKMLQPEVINRSDSRMIREDLRKIYERCKEEDSYATQGEPRKVPRESAVPTRQESPESEDIPQPDLYPKMTAEMERSSSAGRRLGPETKPGDAGEETQAVELGFEGPTLFAEPTHTTFQTVQQLEAIINVDTATRNEQPGSPELDMAGSLPSDSQRLQGYCDSISPEFLHGADELPVGRIAVTTTFHDENADGQRREHPVSQTPVPEPSPTSSTRISDPENETAARPLLPGKDAVSLGTQARPGRESWMRKILKYLDCCS